MERIEPVLAASDDGASVDLLRGSVDLRKRLRSLEQLLKNLVGERKEQREKHSPHEDQYKNYKNRNENSGNTRSVIRQLCPPGCHTRNSGADSHFP